MAGYDIVDPEAIDAGRATAAYFLRTEAVLDHEGADPHVVAELSVPDDRWYLLTGQAGVARLLSGLPVDVDAAPDGTPVTGTPVLRIEGRYRAFARYESSLLGLLAHPSGVATAAMACRAAAGDDTLLSFGTRRQHPALGAMVERAALVGGADGIGNVAAGDLLGVEAGGTMPHALVVALGSPERAWRAFEEALPEDVPRTVVCDTFGDEADEAGRAVAVLGDALDGVRIDTPGSRRGDLRDIAADVRYELDRRGREDVSILVSGGIDPAAIDRLGDVADAFGVGAAIANADPVDCSLNLVAVDGDPVAKRGVGRGAKAVYRDGVEDTVVPRSESAPGEPLMEPLLRDGEIVAEPDLDAACERAAEGLAALRAAGEL
ncbi:MAG: nicotinate phosphoribosyltransferase [Halobacteriaceae archaeon]